MGHENDMESDSDDFDEFYNDKGFLGGSQNNYGGFQGMNNEVSYNFFNMRF
jgi:hypothetical protein